MRKLIRFNEMAENTPEWKIVGVLKKHFENEKNFSIQKLETKRYILTWEEDFLGKNINYELLVYQNYNWGSERIRLISKIGTEVILDFDTTSDLKEALEVTKLNINYTHFFIEYPRSEIESHFLVDLEDELDVNIEDLYSSPFIRLPNGYYCYNINFTKSTDDFLDQLESELSNLDSKLKAIGLKINIYSPGKDIFYSVTDAFEQMTYRDLTQIKSQKYLQINISK